MRGLLKTRRAGSQFLLTVCLAIASFFIIGLIGTAILAPMSGMTLKEATDPSRWDLTKPSVIFMIRGMQVIQFIGLFLIPSLLAGWLFSTNTKQYLGIRKPYKLSFWLAGVAIIMFAIPLANWLGELNQRMSFGEMQEWMKRSEDENNATVRALLSQHTIKELIINLVCISGLAAIGEELFFRGVLQRLLIKSFRSPWAGIIVTAIIFSAMHVQFFGFFPRLLLGILLGAVYWYSGSLLVAMLAHFIYDGSLIVAAYKYPELMNDGESTKLNSLVIAGSVSFLLVVILIEWLKKHSRAKYSEVYAIDSDHEMSHK